MHNQIYIYIFCTGSGSEAGRCVRRCLSVCMYAYVFGYVYDKYKLTIFGQKGVVVWLAICELCEQISLLPLSII